MHATALICTRNREKDLLQALQSIALQSRTFREIIIIDSSDQSLRESEQFNNFFVSKNFGSTRLIYRHTEPGLTRQRNIGIALNTSDIINFFDDDVILERKYLEKVLEIFESNAHYMGGMVNLKNIKKKPWYFYFFRRLFMLQSDNRSGKFTLSGFPAHSYIPSNLSIKNKKNIIPVTVLNGCAAYKKEVFADYLFDENLEDYGFMEDCDFSYRVSRKYKLFYYNQSLLEHFESRAGRSKQEILRRMYVRNYRYLFFKNFYKKNKLKIIFFYWSLLGLFLESFLRKRFWEIKSYKTGLKDRVNIKYHDKKMGLNRE